jgi:hypothetical protein
MKLPSSNSRTGLSNPIMLQSCYKWLQYSKGRDGGGRWWGDIYLIRASGSFGAQPVESS